MRIKLWKYIAQWDDKPKTNRNLIWPTYRFISCIEHPINVRSEKQKVDLTKRFTFLNQQKKKHGCTANMYYTPQLRFA